MRLSKLRNFSGSRFLTSAVATWTTLPALWTPKSRQVQVGNGCEVEGFGLL